MRDPEAVIFGIGLLLLGLIFMRFAEPMGRLGNRLQSRYANFWTLGRVQVFGLFFAVLGGVFAVVGILPR